MQSTIWIAIGATGQVIFCGRFLLQWAYSERAHRSVMPIAFWYASLVGAALLLAFAISRRDPVFILGYGGGAFIYLRNLYLRRHELRDGDSTGAVK